MREPQLATKEEIRMNAFGYDVVIPRGTRTTHNTACGYDPKYNFVDDLSWIPNHLPLLRHDATFYGINLPAEKLEPVTSK